MNSLHKQEDINILGQERAINQLKESIKKFRKGQCILLYGPTGIGKTSSVHILAKELEYELIEFNASHLRNAKSLASILENVVKQKTLFSKGKLILLDEIEGLDGTNDRGAVSTILKIAEYSTNPIILITNDIDSEKIESLKRKSKIIQFTSLDDETIIKILINQCKKQKISFNHEDLEDIALLSDGDARAALLNLHMSKKDKKIDTSFIASRNKKKEIIDVLNVLFKHNNLRLSLDYLNDINTPIIDISTKTTYPVIFANENSLIYWIEENIPYQFQNEELINSFEVLSRIDVFRGRIYRQQHFRFLIYISSLISSISLYTSLGPKTFRKTTRSPKQNFRLWHLVNKKKKNVLEKLRLDMHISQSKLQKEFPYLKMILSKFSDKEIVNYLNLDKEDIDLIKK